VHIKSKVRALCADASQELRHFTYTSFAVCAGSVAEAKVSSAWQSCMAWARVKRGLCRLTVSDSHCWLGACGVRIRSHCLDPHAPHIALHTA
jgi:hypothetical protein